MSAHPQSAIGSHWQMTATIIILAIALIIVAVKAMRIMQGKQKSSCSCSDAPSKNDACRGCPIADNCHK